MLSLLKQRNPKAKVLMEIPTYPYDREFLKVWHDLPFLWKDRYNRKRLSKLIDRLVVVGEYAEQTLFGIPIIQIVNGVDLGSLQERTPSNDSRIDLCAIATFAPWHGYDRLIAGLVNYYQSGGMRNIRMHMVGNGPELEKYRLMAKNPSVSERIIFYGSMSGTALDQIYNDADFGVCSLGMYRKGFEYTSELKSREYLAKGLPIIVGCRVDVLDARTCRYLVDIPRWISCDVT